MRTHKPLVGSSNLPVAIFKTTSERALLMPRTVTLVSWAFAPEWLSIAEASFLSGHGADLLHWLIDEGDIDAKLEGETWLIEKASLREHQETLLKVAQGWWG